MKFRVPQFIDIEDKVIGPLTIKQFGYVLGAGGISFIIWTFVPITILALILMVAVSALFLALAFLKINNRPFGDVLESAFSYYTSAKVYTWKQPAQEVVNNNNITKVISDATKDVAINKASKNRLHEISSELDVLDTIQENS